MGRLVPGGGRSVKRISLGPPPAPLHVSSPGPVPPSQRLQVPRTLPSTAPLTPSVLEGRALAAPEPRPRAGGSKLLRSSSSSTASPGVAQGSWGRGLGRPEALRFADDRLRPRVTQQAGQSCGHTTPPLPPSQGALPRECSLGPGTGVRLEDEARAPSRPGPGGLSERDLSVSFPFGCPRCSPVRPSQRAGQPGHVASLSHC